MNEVGVTILARDLNVRLKYVMCHHACKGHECESHNNIFGLTCSV